MFGNNGHKPILSEMEIRFLLSDWPTHDNPSLHPQADEATATAEGTEKETIVNDLLATIREPR
ncbi:hypothetical protein [Pseudodesulfovibrio karagichevae]|uniref:Uncharacterized protein n=1 Tax=Pseudodesulfovibrio karagichevae TaxID=3239305 RepID=A0ABV4K5H0_9BACT